MDLRHLRYIVASARNGSFSAAAYEFNVRQPIVSKRIKEAEVELKVKLFDRSTAGARLTPAGVDLVVVARRIIEDFDRMAQHARASGAGTVGRVVGFYQSLSAGAFHAAVSDFRKQYPEIEVAGRGFVQLWASPRCAANFPRLHNLRLLRGLINRRPATRACGRTSAWGTRPETLLTSSRLVYAAGNVLPCSRLRGVRHGLGKMLVIKFSFVASAVLLGGLLAVAPIFGEPRPEMDRSAMNVAMLRAMATRGSPLSEMVKPERGDARLASVQ